MSGKTIPTGFRTDKTSIPNLWVIILAGGKGTRMSPLIRKWLGEDRPKQFCTFVGSRSMLQHTIDRALNLVDSKHILIVSTSDQRSFLDEAILGRLESTRLNGQILEQSVDSGTGAAVLMAAAHVQSQDPNATLLILPSDHFFYPEENFYQYADLGVQFAKRTGDRMILLGAKPAYPETDYGWIVPDSGGVRESWDGCRHMPIAVARFHEKPDREEAEAFLKNGGLWSTMVIAVRASVLWETGWFCCPNVMDHFQCLLHALRLFREGHGARGIVADIQHAILQNLDSIDFSRDILQRPFESTWTIPMPDITWGDWGRPERIVKTLASLGKQPLFPLELLDSERSEKNQQPLLTYTSYADQQRA